MRPPASTSAQGRTVSFEQVLVKMTRRLPGVPASVVFISVVLLLTITGTALGPALTHHYAEASPSHGHVFHSGIASSHSHVPSTGHDHDEGTEVVSVTDDSGAGTSSGAPHLAVAGSDALVPPLSVEHALSELTGSTDGPDIPPPGRPPKLS